MSSSCIVMNSGAAVEVEGCRLKRHVVIWIRPRHIPGAGVDRLDRSLLGLPCYFHLTISPLRGRDSVRVAVGCSRHISIHHHPRGRVESSTRATRPIARSPLSIHPSLDYITTST